MIKNLKKLRLEAGTTQQQLADYIMVSQQSVNKYENHDVEPDIDILIKIADYFGVSVDYLVGRTEIREMPKDCCMSFDDINERVIVELVRKLTKKQKEALIDLIKNFK